MEVTPRLTEACVIERQHPPYSINKRISFSLVSIFFLSFLLCATIIERRQPLQTSTSLENKPSGRRLQEQPPLPQQQPLPNENDEEYPEDDKKNQLSSPPPIQNAAIATLVTNNPEDLTDLCLMLKSLVFLKGGYGGSFVRGGPTGMYTFSPVLVFNEGNLSLRQMQRLEGCTSRRVSFPVAQINHYPAGFDPDYEWKGFVRWTNFRPLAGRRDWSYSQMIRFWTTTVWVHPAVQQFDTIMKMDSDACFLRQRYQNHNPTYQEAPGLEAKLVYQTNYDGNVGGNRQYSEGLYDFALDYMEKYKITPLNPELMDVINATWYKSRQLPVFQTSFEIMRKSFAQRRMVQRWHEALTEGEPYGPFRKRWSDAQTRVFTLAMFSKKEEVLFSKSIGFLHGNGRCRENSIDEAHERVATKDHY